MEPKESMMAAAFAILSAAGGFSGAMGYVGGSLRQIDVNTSSINEIRDHGTGLLQALTLQVKVMQAELDGIKRDFRTREYWEANATRLATMEAKMADIEKRLPK